MRSGFTLTEVIVALIVLELGVLGVASLALHAHGLLSEASLRSRAVAVAEEVADSLAVVGINSRGRRSFAGGWVSWAVDSPAGGSSADQVLRRVSISVEDPGGETIFRVRVIVPVAESPGVS